MNNKRNRLKHFILASLILLFKHFISTAQSTFPVEVGASTSVYSVCGLWWCLIWRWPCWCLLCDCLADYQRYGRMHLFSVKLVAEHQHGQLRQYHFCQDGCHVYLGKRGMSSSGTLVQSTRYIPLASTSLRKYTAYICCEEATNLCPCMNLFLCMSNGASVGSRRNKCAYKFLAAAELREILHSGSSLKEDEMG